MEGGQRYITTNEQCLRFEGEKKILASMGGGRRGLRRWASGEWTKGVSEIQREGSP